MPLCYAENSAEHLLDDRQTDEISRSLTPKQAKYGQPHVRDAMGFRTRSGQEAEADKEEADKEEEEEGDSKPPLEGGSSVATGSSYGGGPSRGVCPAVPRNVVAFWDSGSFPDSPRYAS